MPASATDNNEDLALCASCGGICCRTQPGIEHPARFMAAANPADLLAELLSGQAWVLSLHPWRDEATGNWAALYYPRPATVTEQAQGSMLALTDSGDCVFLATDGCRLPFAERPYLCQVLEPRPHNGCTAPWSKRDAAMAWRPHQELVHAAVSKLGAPSLAREF